MGMKFRGRLKKLHRYVRRFENDVPVIHISKVKEILSVREVGIFNKKFKWHKHYKERHACECGHEHFDKRKFKLYAYFWDLERIINSPH